ncbi:hypothetical protein [Bacillus pacificus]|uniref:hypothetical protein n=1 Tax=Bacillus pacificus TaxID=2026187 RepID=UPI00156BCE0F|nr:hypothetical protein [Bacillus pacificus]NRR17622.1 hypothetical protein [Bacillus pacificus]
MTTMLEKMIHNGTEITISGQKMKMRRLNVKDVWRFTKIISKVGRHAMTDFMEFGKEKNEIDEKIQLAQMNEEQQEQLNEIEKQKKEKGLEFVFQLLSMIPECEDEFSEFFSSLLEIKREEFDQLPPEAMVAVIEGLLESEDLMSFFNQVKGLIKSQSLKWNKKEM